MVVVVCVCVRVCVRARARPPARVMCIDGLALVDLVFYVCPGVYSLDELSYKYVLKLYTLDRKTNVCDIDE